MFRIHLSTMLLLITAGIVCTVIATSTLTFGAGLVLLTTGAGGVSAGLMTWDTKEHA